MKPFFKLPTLVAAVLLMAGFLPSEAATSSSEKTVIVTKQPLGSIQEPEDPEPEGRRSPSRPIVISISSEKGVDLPPAMKAEILYFDVVNGQEESVASFQNEFDFAEYVLSMTEPVEIRIIFDTYMLRGFLDQ